MSAILYSRSCGGDKPSSVRISQGCSTFHVFFTFVNYEPITSMWLFLPLLVWFGAVDLGLCFISDDPYLIGRSVAARLATKQGGKLVPSQ